MFGQRRLYSETQCGGNSLKTEPGAFCCDSRPSNRLLTSESQETNRGKSPAYCHLPGFRFLRVIVDHDSVYFWGIHCLTPVGVDYATYSQYLFSQASSIAVGVVEGVLANCTMICRFKWRVLSRMSLMCCLATWPSWSL